MPTQTKTMQLDALLFDLDGTVIDTEELILDSFHAAFDEVLGYRLPDEALLDLIGIPLHVQMQQLCPEHADELVESYRRNNDERHDALVHSFPGMAEALASLQELGLPMVIVTSKRNDFALRGLRVFDLDGFFSMIVGANDTERHKPDPEPLLFAAKQLAVVPERCVYIGDSPYDMQAAVAAGMFPVGASWGVFPAARLLEAGAEVIATAPSELPGLLPSLL